MAMWLGNWWCQLPWSELRGQRRPVKYPRIASVNLTKLRTITSNNRNILYKQRFFTMWNYHRVCYRQVLSVAFWRRWTPSSECNAGLCCTERLANGSTCTQLEAERLDGCTWREITQLGASWSFLTPTWNPRRYFDWNLMIASAHVKVHVAPFPRKPPARSGLTCDAPSKPSAAPQIKDDSHVCP